MTEGLGVTNWGKGRAGIAGLAMLAVGGGLTAGCATPVVLAGAATTGAVVVAEERSTDDVVDDTGIKLAINKAWLETDTEIFSNLNTRVNEGRVLITGVVADPEQRLEAVRIAWQVDGVREVINEIEVAEPAGFSGFARDTAISAQIESRLLFDTSIRSINFTIVTESRVVYVMGIAQDDGERARVIDHARQIPYVRRVVDYTRLKTDTTTTTTAAGAE